MADDRSAAGPALECVPAHESSKILDEDVLLERVAGHELMEQRCTGAPGAGYSRRLDSRCEVQSLTCAMHRRAVASVAAVFHTERVQRLSYGRIRLLTEQFGPRNRLCADARFYGQEAGAYGTAFLVAPDLLVTAAHVVTRLDHRCFAFGFFMHRDRSQVELPAAQIYEAAEVIGMNLDTATGADWAVVRLGRAVPASVPIPRIRRCGRVEDGQELYMIGHPGGLPAKFSSGARVRSNLRDNYFVADLDAYCHSSGSPVFNADDHTIEGLVVRGKGGRWPKNECDGSMDSNAGLEGAGGEDCVRTSLFAHLVPP